MTTAAMLLFITSPICAGEVDAAGDRCVRVDGEAFFPIGVYSAGATVDFPMLADAGFNTVHTYGWEGVRNYDAGVQWLDAAQDSGLMALVGLYRPDVYEMNWDASVKRIQDVRDHPALLAWQTMDEPSWDREGNMGKDYMPAAYDLLKQHDPGHPVTAVVCHFGDTTLFEPDVDIMQADYYAVPPIPAVNFSGTGFHGVKLFVDKWRAASGGEKPYWYVAQGFDFSVSKAESHEIADEWQRAPNRDEIRCMTYTAVASGARGILYWSLSRLLGDEWSRSPLSRVKLWEDLCSVVGELNALMPLLASDSPEHIQDHDRVVSMIKSDGEATHIIVVNYERREVETIVEIPDVENAAAEHVFREGAETIAEGKLSLSLEPLEVRVLRIQPVSAQ